MDYRLTGSVTNTQGGLQTNRVGYEYTGWVTDQQGRLRIHRVGYGYTGLGYRPTELFHVLGGRRGGGVYGGIATHGNKCTYDGFFRIKSSL